MLDNILNSVRRGAGRVQRRGEEVAQVARLRVEVFGLTRELDTLYARLGRSYHSGADVTVLQGVRDEISRVDEEISARERLIRELGEGQVAQEDEAQARGALPGAAQSVAGGATEPTVSDAVPRPHERVEPELAAGGRTITVSAAPGGASLREDEAGGRDPEPGR